MVGQNPLEKGSGDQHLEKIDSSGKQQKTIDAVKKGLILEKLDRSTLPLGSVQDEKIKEFARGITWWKTSADSQDDNSKDLPHLKREWDSIQEDVNTIKETEVYNNLSKKKRKLFEKQLNTFEDIHKDTLSDKHLMEATQAFDTLNTMKDIVNFEQKMYDLTKMTSEQFSAADLTEEERLNIKNRTVDAATKFGWKGTMERATEIIQQVNNPNCIYIIDAISKSEDKSLISDLTDIFYDKQINVLLRAKAVQAVGRLGDKSIVPTLTNVIIDKQFPMLMTGKAIRALYDIDKEKLIEISNNSDINLQVRREIISLLRKNEKTDD